MKVRVTHVDQQVYVTKANFWSRRSDYIGSTHDRVSDFLAIAKKFGQRVRPRMFGREGALEEYIVDYGPIYAAYMADKKKVDLSAILEKAENAKQFTTMTALA